MKSCLILLAFISMAATCQNTNKSSANEENPCDPDMMCTMEFRVLELTLVNEEGTPVFLDDFYTEFGEFTFREQRNEYQIKEGSYPVANDGNMDKLSFKGEAAVFIGIVNGEKIIEHKLKIGKDCCHVVLMGGKEQVVVETK
jgi:hypothetical protein